MPGPSPAGCSDGSRGGGGAVLVGDGVAHPLDDDLGGRRGEDLGPQEVGHDPRRHVEAGLAPERLARLDSVMNAYVAEGKIAGIVALTV